MRDAPRRPRRSPRSRHPRNGRGTRRPARARATGRSRPRATAGSSGQAATWAAETSTRGDAPEGPRAARGRPRPIRHRARPSRQIEPAVELQPRSEGEALRRDQDDLDAADVRAVRVELEIVAGEEVADAVAVPVAAGDRGAEVVARRAAGQLVDRAAVGAGADADAARAPDPRALRPDRVVGDAVEIHVAEPADARAERVAGKGPRLLADRRAGRAADDAHDPRIGAVGVRELAARDEVADAVAVEV